MKTRLPSWFARRAPDSGVFSEMLQMIGDLHLHTICDSAMCPNQGECYSKKTATFLILGNICTRNCTFCAVQKGIPLPVDESEPGHIIDAVTALGLKHVVVTSVTRDDLPDGGASHFVTVIGRLKQLNKVTIEVLVPDFLGNRTSLESILEAGPDVINHNVETVNRLYPSVRPLADFRRSVELLQYAKEINPHVITKSGIMVGLGETEKELHDAMLALRTAGCDLLTVGQYLQPSPRHHPVIRFVTPEEFDGYIRVGQSLGFIEVAAAPLVRSSYQAALLLDKAKRVAHKQPVVGKDYR